MTMFAKSTGRRHLRANPGCPEKIRSLDARVGKTKTDDRASERAACNDTGPTLSGYGRTIPRHRRFLIVNTHCLNKGSRSTLPSKANSVCSKFGIYWRGWSTAPLPSASVRLRLARASAHTARGASAARVPHEPQDGRLPPSRQTRISRKAQLAVSPLSTTAAGLVRRFARRRQAPNA